MKNLFICFAMLCSLGLWGQNIYVRAYAADKGGWIVTPEGETLCELPGGWRVSGHDAAMAPVEEWPMLLWRRGAYPAPNKYAFLHRDGSLEELPQLTWAREMGHQLLAAIMNGERGVLYHKDGRVLGRGLNMLNDFDERGLTVAGYGGYQGLIDTLGQFCLVPQYRSVVSLGKSCYAVEDTLQQNYLLRLKNHDGQTLRWDTLVDLSAKEWSINTSQPFSEDGYLMVQGKDKELVILDTNGQLLAQQMTLAYRNCRPFREGRAIVGTDPTGRKLGVIDEEGQLICEPNYNHLLDYAYRRALAQDTITGQFGYLNPEGQWAIAARYCEATSFRHGLAIVNDPKMLDLCTGNARQKGDILHQPGRLTYNRVIRDYQLLDTSGQVVWQDSCREVWLPVPGVVGCNYNEGTYVPAYRLEWLATGKYWLSPDFVFTRWEQVAEATNEEVIRLNLGARRWQMFRQQVYPLPHDFGQRLPALGALEDLNLDFHLMTTAWETILGKKSLRKLHLRHCQLTVLPKELNDLEQLEELDVSENELTELPRSIFRMKHLQVLNIKDNPLPPSLIPRLRKALPDTEIVYK
ncbi:WG repeat-containing protein [Lewinella sp. LCG006]|uniref:WG repeat-containing protein n=1 Tax=Lewinella sp. LCG006 TaxID=3231911 RepID=UPI00345FD9A8